MLSLVVPSMAASSQFKSIANGTFTVGRKVSDDDEMLSAVYQTKMIIGCAILEGVGFLNTFTYSSSGQVANAAIAGLLILGVLLHFPTVGRITGWIEQRKHDLSFARK
jgi:hypothetical protein